MTLLLSGARRARGGVVAGLAAPAAFQSRSRAAAVGSLSAAVAAEVVPPPFSPVADTRAGVCVVGCGRMGQIRTEGILANPGTRLVSVVDPNKEQATALAKKTQVPAFW